MSSKGGRTRFIKTLIRAQREQLGWGQNKLAEKAGLSKRKIQELEAGHGGMESVRRVNEALRAGWAADPGLKTFDYKDIRTGVTESESFLSAAPVVADDQSSIEHSSSYAKALLDREDAYTTIAILLEKALVGGVKKREVYLAALHGLGNMPARTEDKKAPPPSAAMQRFDDAMHKCIASTGTDRVYVSILYCVSDQERFNQIEKRTLAAGDAEGYDVRAFCLRDSPPFFAPLIIGEEDAFIGVQEPGRHRIKNTIHFHGRDHVTILMEYWNLLWTDERAIILRDPLGVKEEGFAELREQLRSNAASWPSSRSNRRRKAAK